jgi:hypothetical protein
MKPFQVIMHFKSGNVLVLVDHCYVRIVSRQVYEKYKNLVK